MQTPLKASEDKAYQEMEEQGPSSPYNRKLQLQTSQAKNRQNRMPYIGADDRIMGTKTADGVEQVVTGSPQKKLIRDGDQEIDLRLEEELQDEHLKDKIFINKPPNMVINQDEEPPMNQDLAEGPGQSNRSKKRATLDEEI